MSFTALYGWIAQHPHLAGLAVFWIALAESLAVVGLLVPGVAMMFAAGALVGAGALPFWPICAYAVVGAIAGDGLSFWLGWRYRDRLGAIWPFARHPGMIEHGVAFFRRYGGRGVLFGRFVGPVRAVIPLVAGMLAMPARRFVVINVLSALLWAPAYLLPGMAFGASVDLASRVTERLAALAIALLAVLWFTAWLGKRLYAYFQPRAHGLILATFDLSRSHPWLGRLAIPLIDPSRRDYPGLAVWAMLLAALGLAACVLAPPELAPVSLRAWRNPLADYALTVCEELGGTPAILVFSATVGGWLLMRERSLAAAHLLAGVGFALLLGALCGAVAQPPLVDARVLNGAVAYGFVAILLADQTAYAWRWPVYAAAALLAIAISFARLYSEAGEFPAVCVSLMLALVWLIVLGVAYRRHRHAEPPVAGLPWLVPLALAAVVVALWNSHSAEEFAQPLTPIQIDESEWLNHAWRTLPGYRARIFGRPNQSLAVQWALSLEGIRADLSRNGWRIAQPLSPRLALGILNPDAGIAELPVLPHFNQAEVDALRMVKPIPGGRWLIARFWASGLESRRGKVPIWLIGVAFLETREWFGLLKFAEESGNDTRALALFESELRARFPITVRSAGEDRSVLLVPP